MAGETTTRLTMFAEAMGFDSTASSAELLAAALKRLGETTEALQTARTSGAVGELPQLMEDEQILRQYIAELTPAQQAQEELNLSMRNFVGLVRQVSPGLAFYVEGLFRSVHVVGQLANKNLELGSALKGAGNFIKENAASLALLGAGGAVVFAIDQITGAYAKMGEELEKVTAKIKKQQDAVNELKRAEQDQQQTIESISDKRREGGLTADQARAAEQQAAGIGKRFGKSISTESINRAEALLGGQGLSDDQMADAGFLMDAGKLELDEKARPEARRRAFDRALRRNAADIAKFRAREGTQAGSIPAGAAQEVRGAAAGTLSIVDFIKSLPGTLAVGMDADKLGQIVQALPGMEGKYPSFTQIFPNFAGANLFSKALTDMVKGHGPAFSDIEDLQAVLAGEGIKAEPEEIRAAEFVQQQLNKANRNGRGGNVTIDNSTHNYTEAHRKMIVPGQRAREEASMNGAARARLAEE